MHLQRRRELHEKEIDTCLEKLDEIKTKLDKGQKNMNERMEEKTSYLKT
jgi:chaperonin cofactor prefoldin